MGARSVVVAAGVARAVIALELFGLVAGGCAREARREEPDIQAFVRRLSGNDLEDISYASTALERIGAKAVPALVAALRSPDVNTRQGAINVLHNMGAPAAPALPALRELLKDPVDYIRGDAASAIRDIEERVEATNLEHVQAWIDGLAVKRDGDERVLLQRRLEGAGKAALPRLVQALEQSPSADVRIGVAAVLRSMGREAEPAIPALRALLWNAKVNRNSSEAAAEALLALQPEVTVPELVRALEGRDDRARTIAVSTLAAMTPPPAAALPGFIRVVAERHAGIGNAIFGLMEIGPAAKSAVPVLLKAQNTKYHEGDVLRALAHISPSDPVVQAAIRRGIAKGDSHHRTDAINAALESGQVTPYASDILAASQDKDPKVREYAELFLGRHPEIREQQLPGRTSNP